MSVPYRLVRSRRRTLAVHITEDAAVEVRAPLRLPQSRIEEFLQEKRAWVARELARAQARHAQREAFCPTALLYLGREYPVRRAKKAAFDGNAFLLPGESWDAALPAAVRVYRALAQEHIGARLAHWCGLLGAAPTGWSITSAEKRWGSCSGRNRLSFSWRLVLAPPDAVDYVVVHELCHMRHHNHSRAFWDEVARLLPDYARRRELLRALEERLLLERWDAHTEKRDG